MPDQVNSLDNLAVGHVKQGIEAGRFRTVPSLVQSLHILAYVTRRFSTIFMPPQPMRVKSVLCNEWHKGS